MFPPYYIVEYKQQDVKTLQNPSEIILTLFM